MFDGENYISLVTFRKDGSEVPTPVWFAKIGKKLWVFTDGTSYKVKRLRRNPAIRAAACGVFGEVTGPWFEGNAKIVTDTSAIADANRALLAKYGWQLRSLNVLSTLGGRIGRRAYLEIEVRES